MGEWIKHDKYINKNDGMMETFPQWKDRIAQPQ